MTAGYSGTPLIKKLGIKAGFKIRLLQAPKNYFTLIGCPTDITVVTRTTKDLDLIHYFATSKAELQKQLPLLKTQIKSNGTIWISWPKQAAKVATDVSENIVRNIALATGLVDVKVAAIDATWSGLKLVLRLKDRK